jgi:hypothetical protein
MELFFFFSALTIYVEINNEILQQKWEQNQVL